MDELAPRLVASVVDSLPALTSGEDPSIAARLLRRIAERPDPAAVAAVDAALVLLADHGLAASTTAARLAAAYRADVCGTVGAGLAVLGGTWHGGASTRVEALLRRLLDGEPTARVLGDLRSGGVAVPGFGQPLYPDGDPRYPALRHLIAAARSAAPVLDMLDHLELTALRAGLPPPNVDCGLAALTLAFDLAPRSGELVFAVARMAGWIAHGIEAAHHEPPRLRATYVGREPRRGA